MIQSIKRSDDVVETQWTLRDGTRVSAKVEDVRAVLRWWNIETLKSAVVFVPLKVLAKDLPENNCDECGETVYRCDECDETPQECRCEGPHRWSKPDIVYIERIHQSFWSPAEGDEYQWCPECYMTKEAQAEYRGGERED